jgi:two-component system, cell cycle response regulator
VVAHLTVASSRAHWAGKPIAVALADVDHFKHVNDTHGHAAGDAILREATTRLRGALRAYDAIGRYGGEEFLIVLPDCDTNTGLIIAERARISVAAPMCHSGIRAVDQDAQ